MFKTSLFNSVAHSPDGEAGTSTTEVGKVDPSMTFMKDVKFSFKKLKDEPVETPKRPSVELKIPYPTKEGIVAFLQHPEKGEKNWQFLLDTFGDIVKEQARQQVSDDDAPVNSQDKLDLSKLDLTYIANLPPSERRAGGIAKEVWENFGKLYNEVMPGVTGKKADQVSNAAILLMKRYNPVKTNKSVIKILKDQLALFFSNINEEQQTDYADLVDFLDKKADALLNSNEAELLTNL